MDYSLGSKKLSKNKYELDQAVLKPIFINQKCEIVGIFLRKWKQAGINIIK